MIRAFAFCAVLLATSVVRAEDDHRLIQLSVTIVSGPSEKLLPDAAAQDLAKAIGDLEKSGDLTSLTRLQFAALEDQQVKFQFGESVSVVTGRSGQSGRGGNPTFGGGGFPGSVSMGREQAGTLVGAVARIVDGAVVAQLDIEQTRLQPKPASDDAALPPGSNTLSFKSVVRIPQDKTLVVAAMQDRAADSNWRTLVLISASLPEGAGKKRADISELKIFALKNANAEELRSLLVQLYPDLPMSIAADERTNCLIVRGSHEQMVVFEALALRLDEVNRDEKR